MRRGWSLRIRGRGRTMEFEAPLAAELVEFLERVRGEYVGVLPTMWDADVAWCGTSRINGVRDRVR